MPLYQFECASCNHKEEIFKKMSEYNILINCPKCNKKEFKKSFTPLSFKFNGDGFYCTDFK